MQRRLDVVLGCSVTAGHALGKAVRKCPALLFASTPKSMGVIAESLSGFFSRAQVLNPLFNIVPTHMLISEFCSEGVPIVFFDY